MKVRDLAIIANSVCTLCMQYKVLYSQEVQLPSSISRCCPCHVDLCLVRSSAVSHCGLREKRVALFYMHGHNTFCGVAIQKQ